MWQLFVISALIVTSFHLAASEQPFQKTGCECVSYDMCPPHKVVEGTAPCEGPVEVCCEPAYIKRTTLTRSRGWQYDGCGNPAYVPKNTKSNVHNPRNAEFSEFPWMVAIHDSQLNWHNYKRDTYLCGGALIRHNAVITAAHCVDGKSKEQLKVWIGVRNYATSNSTEPYQEISVNKIIIHENFTQQYHLNDYAIILLKNSVNFARNIGPVCLPEPDQQFDKFRCVVSHWGDSTYGHLQRETLLIVNRDDCEQIYRKYFNQPSTWIQNSLTCTFGIMAGYPGKGDNGSPMVCRLQESPQRYVLVGIVAVPLITYDKSGRFNIYGNVTAARKWINDQIELYNGYED